MRPRDIARRDFLWTAGLGAAGAGLWPGSLFGSPAAEQEKTPPTSAKDTLDALLKRNQEYERRAGAGGPNNHVPMTLIALYRMGASSQAMDRYVAAFDLEASSKPEGDSMDSLTRENWRSQLGRAGFSRYLGFFEGWMEQTSVDAVLHESVSTLMKGSISQFYHTLLRLGYAIDYGSRDEVVFSLAHWAASYRPSPDFDARCPAVEPDALFSEIVESSSAFQIKPRDRSLDEVMQMYSSSEFSRLLKPVRLDSNPLDRVSELIMETFRHTQHFDLLHLLTSCQALRLVLPYASDPQKSLSEYWHSACATYVAVARKKDVHDPQAPGGRRKFEIGKDSVAAVGPGWEAIHAAVVDNENKLAQAVERQHDIKLIYSCWSESQHYERDMYLALAARELERSSPL